MLNRMCSRLPCNHPALRMVHQRPYSKIGIAPLSPNRNNAGLLGERIENKPEAPSAPAPDMATVVSSDRT